MLVFISFKEEDFYGEENNLLVNQFFNTCSNNTIDTPKVEGICDICGNNLTSRSDDNEESFKVRYNTYINNCESVFNYYKNRNILYMVDSNKDPETTFNSVEEIITKVN